MSTDAQPRRRKEKRRKKETSSGDRTKAEAEYIARKLSVADDSDEGNSPAPPKSPPRRSSPAFGEGDSIIHVDHDHGTGGHWCAKIIFFVLLAALMVLIGLIIVENRGLTDLDAPVTESRFAQIFDGWVDEGPVHDDHHDEHTLELKHHDDDHDDEGDDENGHDEEIEDIESDVEDGEHDEDAAHDDDDNDDDDHDNDEDIDDHDEDEIQENSAEESQEIDEGNDDDNSIEQDTDNVVNDDDDLDDDDDDDNNNDDDDDDNNNDDDDDNENINDDNDDDANSIEDEQDENLSTEINEDHSKYDDENYNGAEEDDDDDYINIYRDQAIEDNGSDEKHAVNQESTEDILNFSNEDDIEDTSKDIPFEEVDSFEEDVVDNTAGEEELLAAKKAEKLAQEQEENNNMGMRVTVGVALVLVTYCVLARKWRNANEDDDSEELPTDRRMTLLPDDVQDNDEENEIVEDVIQSTTSTSQKSQSRVYDDEKENIEKIAELPKLNPQTKETMDKVLATNQKENEDEIEKAEEEDEEEIEYEEEEEEPFVKNVNTTLQDSSKPEYEEVEEEEEELIDDELDEEVVEEEEEDEEEEISEELDDSELMKKLEEKYGKLPDYEDEAEGNSDEEKPVVPARKRPKPTGGNSIEEDNWSVDSNDDWKLQLDLAQAEMDEGKVEDAFRHFTSLSLTNPLCWRAKLGRAKSLDLLAEVKRNNNILDSAISAYREVLNMTISRKEFIAVAERTIDRLRFRGKHVDAVNIHNKLIEKFPLDPKYRNQLAITYLMVNKVDLARNILKETLNIWPANGVALVHYGFILKTIDNNLEEGVLHMKKGIDTKENGTLEGRFLYHLGDALARLGQQDEASKIYQLGASNKVFLSSQQRSLYNVDRLTGRPWWRQDQTPYVKFFKSLESNWKKIAKEASEIQSHFKLEQENLKDTGHWSQYELFFRGVEIKSHCAKCPVTCQIARSEPAAYGCRRGQIKFSAMTPGTHVYAHTGPTNCRLRAHLGLHGTKDTYLRVGKEIRSWNEGKILIFDDSFEHEVWHNGSSLRIVLIVDLWHPELTKEEKLSLPAI